MPDSMLETIAKDYSPEGHIHGLFFSHDHRLPPFLLWFHVPQMMRDSRINIALNYIKGAILSKARFFVDDGSEADTPSDVKQFIIRQIERWWRNSVIKQMSAIEWGYSGHEVIYAWRDNLYEFDHLNMFQTPDVKPVTKDNELQGIHVEGHLPQDQRPRFIATGKSLWHIQGREFDPWFGKSRLFPAYEAWTEMYSFGGARDIRRKYFYKNGFRGDVLYHPTTSIPDANGQLIPAKQHARSIVEKEAAGGVVTFPGTRDAKGNLEWFFQAREHVSMAADVLNYIEVMKTEFAEGLGVSKELIEAADTGSGFSGRRIPQDAFHATLLDPLTWLIADFDEQVLSLLLQKNFGIIERGYEIIPFGLLDDPGSEQENGNGNGNQSQIAADPGKQDRLPSNAMQLSQTMLCI